MKIGVISDTHGNVIVGEKIIKEMGKIDLLIHGGDFYRDAVKLAERINVKVEAVVGNCDFPKTSPEELILDIQGCRLYITHGHKFNVKNFYNDLLEKAKDVGADLVIFGHTHLAAKFEQEGIIFFNPGSISFPRLRDTSTYGIIEILEGVAEADIYSYE